jgi:hypothetical protein
LIWPEYLEQSLAACKLFVTVLEDDGRYVNRSPKGEPQLGKRGLYGAIGGLKPAVREHAMLWVLNQSDGSHSLLDIARRSGLAFDAVRDAAVALERAGLLRPKAKSPQVHKLTLSPRPSGRRKNTKGARGITVGRRRAALRGKGAKP